MTEAGGNKFRYEIHRSINCIRNKEELPHKWKNLSLHLLIKGVMELTVVIIEECNKLYPVFFS
jgi:hypothetical protein